MRLIVRKQDNILKKQKIIMSKDDFTLLGSIKNVMMNYFIKVGRAKNKRKYEVNIMAYNKKEAQGKIQKLGELMTAKKYDEAWTSAGDLNAYLKANKDVMTGSDYEAINGVLKNYYNINNQLEAVGKRAYGMGQKALNTQL